LTDVRPSLQRRQPGFSGWALAALLCSTVLFCPLATMLGVLLGVRSLYHVRAVPGRRGRGVAMAAIVIGLVATVGWITFGLWWNRNARQLMHDGPSTFIAIGQAGDVEGFRDGFVDGGGTPEAATGFLQALTAEHGLIRSARQGDAQGADGPVLVDGRLTIRYVFLFDEGEAAGRAEFVVFEEGLMDLELRFGWVEVEGPGGRLRYPERERP
jgi:hypothetical protein